MKVLMPVNNYQTSSTNIKPQRNISQPLSFDSFSSKQSVKSSNVSFSGIGSFVARLIGKNNNTKIIPSAEAEKVFELLSKQEFGVYALTSDGYKFISPSDYKNIASMNVSEIVMKQPINQASITTGFRDKPSVTEVHSYRDGISPFMVMDSIENGFLKVTSIVDDGMHVLTLPEKASDRNKAYKAFKRSGYLESQGENTIYIMPKSRPDFCFDLAKKMIGNFAGFKLEKL